MSIKTACPCGATYKVSRSAIGKQARCKQCHALFIVQASDAVPIGDLPTIGDMDDHRTGDSASAGEWLGRGDGAAAAGSGKDSTEGFGSMLSKLASADDLPMVGGMNIGPAKSHPESHQHDIRSDGYSLSFDEDPLTETPPSTNRNTEFHADHPATADLSPIPLAGTGADSEGVVTDHEVAFREPVIVAPTGPPVVEEPAGTEPDLLAYGSGMLWSLAWPSSGTNVAAFVFLVILMCGAEIALPLFLGAIGAGSRAVISNYMILLGGALVLVHLAIYGLYAAYLFGTIEAAAGNEEENPAITIIGSFVDDILDPLAHYLFATLVAFLPLSLFLLNTRPHLALTLLFSSPFQKVALLAGASPIVLCLFFLGRFLWPMIALCVALGGFSVVLRPKLLLITLRDTIGAYLAVALLFNVQLLVGHWAGTYVEQLLGPNNLTPVLPYELMLTVIILALTIYLEVFAMRCIGLYYHYNKSRFAWNWG